MSDEILMGKSNNMRRLMADERVVYKNGFDIYRDHSVIPIEDIAESLGLDLRKDGTTFYLHCPCPDHNDNNPSARLSTAQDKYENTFKCWSCGEHGGVLELVAAVKYGVKPSFYRDVVFDKTGKYTAQEHAQMRKVRDDSARYIETICPGNIEIRKIGEKTEKSEDGPLQRPEIPNEIWKELGQWMGISRSAGLPTRMLRYPNPEVVDGGKTKEEISRRVEGLSDLEYANLMYGKLDELISRLNEYKDQILRDFPDLDAMAEIVIKRTIMEKIEKIEPVREAYRTYLLALEDAECMKNLSDDYLVDDLDDPKSL